MTEKHSPLLTRRAAASGVVFAALLTGIGAFAAFGGRNDAGPAIGGPFSLIDGDGRTVTDRSFRGKYMLVYFGYTFCPDICPTTLSDMADAMDRLGARADDVQPIFITVDPERDTSAVMKRYAAQFSPRLIGLTGSPEAIAKVAKEYGVYYAPHRTGPGSDDYTVDHSSILYLMGPDGRFVAPVAAGESGTQMASDIGRLVS